MESLGIIAGNREFPLLVARSARDQGIDRIVAVGFSGITSPELEGFVDEMVWIGVGQVGRLVKTFQSRDVQRLVMVGQIPHRLALGSLKFDLEGLKFFKKVREKNARTILGALIQELEEKGFQFLDSTQFLENQLALKGVLTRTQPTAEHWADLEYGWKVAKVLADLEIGQTVVVKKGVIIALEGIEGTDQAILRGGELGGKGTVIVKVARSKQDMRYDVPVVGLETLQALEKAKSSVLGIEEGKTLILDKEAFLKQADRMKLVITGLAKENGKA